MKFEAIKEEFEKNWGEGSIISLADNYRVKCDVIPSQSISLDHAMGVGGYPRGRVIEIFGPEASGKTTLALHAVASAQKLGGKAAFIDVEHALSPQLMVDMGIDPENTLISQPDSGEQALEMCELLVASNAVDLVVVDSVAALVPLAELQGDVNENKIGAQARMMSQFLRRITAQVKKSKTAVIFINQIRYKIGVMFGCLHADTLVNFVDGRAIRIKDIVDNKIEGEVWSYDESTDQFVAAKIIDWHHNGDINDKSDYISIYLKCPGNKNGFVNIVVTPDHKVLTDNGWLEAENLCVGGKILTKQESIINGTCGEFLRGVLSGDSHISQAKNHLSSALKIRDNSDLEYARWKAEKLNDIMRFTETKCGLGVHYVSKHFSELTDIKNNYPNRDPMLLLNDFNWMGFAIWIMDDASYNRHRYHLSIKRFKGNFEKIDEISRELDSLGLYHHASYGGNIIFDKDISDKIAGQIAKYVPICMRHKLPPDAEAYRDFELIREREFSTTYAEILDMREAGHRQMRNIGKYDISVEKYHNYSVGGSYNGVIVHNSPETTPGGNALKFYASIRLDIRKIGAIKSSEKDETGDETGHIGHDAKIKVIKNKVATPFKSCQVPLIYGKGIDYNMDLIDMATKCNVITRAGAWLAYKDQRIGMGKINATKFLAEHKELVTEIDNATRAILFPPDKYNEEKPDLEAEPEDLKKE